MRRYLLLWATNWANDDNNAKKLNANHSSLYKGQSEETLANVAPYLFTLEKDSYFENWFISNGWGNSCGVIVSSSANFEECLKHFRKFLIVKTEEGTEMYFHFYDPSVLKIFLPSCDKNQILEFFGPIESFICEGDTKEEAIRFWQENGELKQEILPVEKVFGNITTLTTVTPS